MESGPKTTDHNQPTKSSSKVKGDYFSLKFKKVNIKKEYLQPLSIITGSIIIAIAIIISGNPAKAPNLKGSPQAVAPTANNQAAAAPPQAPAAQSADNVLPLQADDHIRGDKNARVLLIEYSDLECPFCKQFHSTAQAVVDSNQGEVAWVYRHFPLDQIHPKARKSAEAVECAANQGGNDAFWALTDSIFEAMPSMTLEQLPTLATQAGLNRSTFQSCLDSGEMASKVDAQYQTGVSVGINGTPGNILLDTETGETKLLFGAYPLDQIQSEIDSLINAS